MATGGILTAVVFYGSLSTIVGDEKLTSSEGQIGLLFLYVQSSAFWMYCLCLRKVLKTV